MSHECQSMHLYLDIAQAEIRYLCLSVLNTCTTAQYRTCASESLMGMIIISWKNPIITMHSAINTSQNMFTTS